MTSETPTRVRVLGRVAVDGGDGWTDVPAGRQSLVLTHLVLRRGEVVSDDRLAEGLWADALPADPANALQYVIARLRRLLDPGRDRRGAAIERAADGYVLRLPTTASDVGALEDAVARDDVGLATLESVLDSWTGRPFSAFPDDRDLTVAAHRLERLHLTVLERWAEASIAAGRRRAAVARLSTGVGTEPGRFHEGLHRQLGLALAQDGEQAAALRVIDALVDRLADELGIDPSTGVVRLRDAILRGEVGATRRVVTGAGALPVPPDSLVGRDEEVAATLERLATGRLVTVVGAPGVGTSRVGLEAARRLVDDGVEVLHVPLADVRDPALVGPAVLAAAGLPENPDREVDDVVADSLGDHVLLLDHCAHLLPALADRVGRWLRSGLRVLATSHGRIGLRGEHVVVLDGLGAPPVGGDPAASPAVALFCRRAAALDPSFVADRETLAEVAALVRRVDGLPLAIELAAGRARTLGVAEVATRLATTLDVLTTGERDRPSRHRTLGGALDWALAQLDEDDRRLLEALAPFGSFDLTTAERVAGDATVEQLSRLVDRSLVRRDDATGRFAMLWTLRTHLWDVLGTDRRAAVVGAFLDWAVTVVEQAGGRLRGPGQLAAMAVLDREHDTVRTALMAATGPHGDVAVAMRILQPMSRYWDWRGRFAEAAHWFEQVEQAAIRAGVEPHPALVTWAAFAAEHVGDHDRADALVARAVRSGWVEEETAVPGGLVVRSVIRRRRGDVEGAIADARAVLDAGVAADSAWAQGWANDALAHAMALRGDVELARAYAERALGHFTDAGDARGRAWALTGLADAAGVSGDVALAARTARAAVDAALAVDDSHGIAWALELLAAAHPGSGAVPRLRGAAGWLRAEPVDGAADAPPDGGGDEHADGRREGRELARRGSFAALLTGL